MTTWSKKFDGDPDKTFTYIIEYEGGSFNRRKFCKYLHPLGVRAGEEVSLEDEIRRNFHKRLEDAVQEIHKRSGERRAFIIDIHRIYSIWATGAIDYCEQHITGPYEFRG